MLYFLEGNHVGNGPTRHFRPTEPYSASFGSTIVASRQGLTHSHRIPRLPRIMGALDESNACFVVFQRVVPVSRRAHTSRRSLREANVSFDPVRGFRDRGLLRNVIKEKISTSSKS